MEGNYLGNKRVRLVHGPSGAELLVDAPRDNAGRGAFFSPTDLLAAAWGACGMIVMGIVAERSGIDLSGMSMRVEKEMRNEPRRIGALSLELHLPAGLPEEHRNYCIFPSSIHPLPRPRGRPQRSGGSTPGGCIRLASLRGLPP